MAIQEIDRLNSFRVLHFYLVNGSRIEVPVVKGLRGMIVDGIFKVVNPAGEAVLSVPNHYIKGLDIEMKNIRNEIA